MKQQTDINQTFFSIFIKKISAFFFVVVAPIIDYLSWVLLIFSIHFENPVWRTFPVDRHSIALTSSTGNRSQRIKTRSFLPICSHVRKTKFIHGFGRMKHKWKYKQTTPLIYQEQSKCFVCLMQMNETHRLKFSKQLHIPIDLRPPNLFSFNCSFNLIWFENRWKIKLSSFLYLLYG